MTHDMRIAAADAAVAKLLRVVHRHLVFILTAATVVDLYDADAFRDAQLFGVSSFARSLVSPLAPRM